jgi:hypothetical protein
MNIGDQTRHVISSSKRTINTLQGKRTTNQVVYKTAAYRIKGKMKFDSKTRHEVV